MSEQFTSTRSAGASQSGVPIALTSAATARANLFFLSNSSIKSRLHFFPSAGVTTGAYGITCALTLFGKGVEKRTVMLDGGRLGQPDGLRLEDAFPSLRGDIAGIFGLSIELSCSQPRLQLDPSQAAIESVSPQFSIMYGAARFKGALNSSHEFGQTQLRLEENDGEKSEVVNPFPLRTAICLQDAALVPSLVVVNPSSEVLRPAVFKNSVPQNECSFSKEEPSIDPLDQLEWEAELKQVPLGTVAAESVVEIPLDETLFKDSATHQCLWGGLRAESVSIRDDEQEIESPSYFIIYRDAVTKRPSSVSCI